MRPGTALGFDSRCDDPTSQAAWRKRQTNEQTEWRNQAFGWEGGVEDNAPRIASSYQIIASSWSRIAIIDSTDIKHRCPIHDHITKTYICLITPFLLTIVLRRRVRCRLDAHRQKTDYVRKLTPSKNLAFAEWNKRPITKRSGCHSSVSVFSKRTN